MFSVGKIVDVGVVHFGELLRCNARYVEMVEDVVEGLAEDFGAAYFGGFFPSVGCNEVADAPLVVDNANGCEVVEGFHHGVGVHGEVGGVVAYGGDALVGGVLAGDYLVADALGYLEVDGAVFGFEFKHGRGLEAVYDFAFAHAEIGNNIAGHSYDEWGDFEETFHDHFAEGAVGHVDVSFGCGEDVMFHYDAGDGGKRHCEQEKERCGFEE